jgi:flagellar FliL protein
LAGEENTDEDRFRRMAEEANAEQLDEQVEIEAKPKKGLSGKKLVLLVILPLLLLGGGGAGAYFGGFLDPFLGKAGGHEAAVDEGETLHARGSTTFYELPEMLVNLESSGRRTNYLKLVLALELEDDDDVAELEDVLPRIVDNFQVYLRELRIEDLHGSAGMQRLREELLLRVNASTKTARVRDVLFKEMLVQ